MKKYTLGLYEKAMPSSLSWEERLTEAKNAGFDFVEISIDETDEKLARLDWSASERLELVRTMEKNRSSHPQHVFKRPPQVSSGKPQRGDPGPEHGDYGESHCPGR